ncbi:hypothetical protein AN931_23285 [Mycobacterium intracellulare subsp. chimaera]|mgnify:FL=1|uniref:DUF3800 domain-containing protein n=1 Tax=Mycobacterium parascrofulaceum ATCC BAA-614 TaxID=525368 RepID=D5P6M5_9MYCO|nr:MULTISPECIES: hypothetical protein [Mycobacterium]AOS95124.1 hypothetical protein AN480_29180 [Mycobacterium intracellulare subsp. chimaera]EFG78295.1 hypothetical protein HMPREF0591_1819 [Mycobacterium parascrofulaceum ATCC BAA-614]KLO34067.1 hypothetical protein ABW17_27140 [Mycobacterium nebraskense]KPN48673.1 hypothetical protein AN931_23285 [Mycobacterium intracellulare subsp. chimaera]MCA2322807.1 hypothetical protein [Mycobacterium intracellulare]
MTARHVYVDETKHRDYLMVAAVVLGEDLTSARGVVQDLLKPGQQHLHMKDEADGRKETIAKTLAAADLRATVYDAGRRHHTQVLARAACLSALVDDLAASDVETLIVLDQDETLVQSDRRLLYHAVRAAGREATLRYEHRRAAAERLLGIPDAFAWCWAKGGYWRSHIRSVITVQTV